MYALSGPLGLGDLPQENWSSCEVFMVTTRPPTLPGGEHKVVTMTPQLGPSPAIVEVRGLKQVKINTKVRVFAKHLLCSRYGEEEGAWLTIIAGLH